MFLYETTFKHLADFPYYLRKYNKSNTYTSNLKKISFVETIHRFSGVFEAKCFTAYERT